MRILAFMTLLLCSFSCAVADGAPEAPAVNQASNATFDKRLPPVIPGEELKDGKGKSKVWSTSGPVPVSRAAEPWRDQHNQEARELLGGGGVVVDARKEPSE